MTSQAGPQQLVSVQSQPVLPTASVLPPSMDGSSLNLSAHVMPPTAMQLNQVSLTTLLNILPTRKRCLNRHMSLSITLFRQAWRKKSSISAFKEDNYTDKDYILARPSALSSRRRPNNTLSHQFSPIRWDFSANPPRSVFLDHYSTHRYLFH